MKKVLFISEEFLPLSNGTVTCTVNILQELTKLYEVTLYVGFNSQNIDNEDGIDNLTIKTPKLRQGDILLGKLINQRYEKINRLQARKTQPLLVKLYKLITSPILILANNYGYSTYNGWGKNLASYISANEKIEDYTAVIAIAAPFSNIQAAVKLKRKHTGLQLILIEFDLYTDNATRLSSDAETLHGRLSRLREENQWYELADEVIVTEEMCQSMCASELSAWQHKITSAKIPSLVFTNNSNDSFSYEGFKHDSTSAKGHKGQDINIVYSGRFYEDIRNPTFMLELFTKIIAKNKNIKLHIYGQGCEGTLEHYKSLLGDNMLLHGYVAKTEIEQALGAAPILLNLSNAVDNQAPSKIIEYIATGKPIINVYSIDKDLCKEILSQYALSLSVQEAWDDLELLAARVYQFILNNQGKRTERKTIMKNYAEYTPEIFVKNLSKAIK